MQFQVPQNITMEDRIVWFLSPLQFGIVVIGWGLSFAIYTSQYIPSPLNSGLGAFLALLTTLIAIGKFNDQPLYNFARFIIAFIVKPKIRIWHKEGGDIQLVKAPDHKDEPVKKAPGKNISHGDIAQLAAVLDSRGNVGKAPKVGGTGE